MSKRYATFAVMTAALIALTTLLAGCGKPDTPAQQAQEDLDSKSEFRAIYDPLHFKPAIASASNVSTTKASFIVRISLPSPAKIIIRD